ncbi:MAG: spore coat associated protein CotJA [Defluviitaleaceae bacterium]|nr:spore coat associated protein CotJA [Defluviitaleaceae bacterium]
MEHEAYFQAVSLSPSPVVGVCPTLYPPAPTPPHNEHSKQVIGMAYVPPQIWRDIYDADYGFMRGTIFSELDKPWFGGKCHE